MTMEKKSIRVKWGFVGKSDYSPLWHFKNIWSMPGISFSLKKKAYNGSIVCDNIRDNYDDYNTSLKFVCIFNLYECMDLWITIIIPIIKP